MNNLFQDNIRIRTANPNDLQSVQDLNYELFLSDNKHFGDLNTKWPHEQQGKQYFESMIGDKGACFVAELNGEVVGYIAGVVHPKHSTEIHVYAELENMCVTEAYRNQGIGAKLVDELYKWAKQQSADMFIVAAYTPNTSAVKFYEQNGFEPFVTKLVRTIT